ncbi:hypothetical protein [Alistipes sp.]|uniref:hypothetical protein n=1 Tax=Alistipes sp. TaxID=1872444 RepID=UPI0025C5FD64|nr:hypothetical protein [Alistipes sp.]
MKNSTHYRLRTLACALLASATMLGACSDDDPNDTPNPGVNPPEKLVDQIQYDGGDKVNIKSAIYVVEEDGNHTFYLSPTEGLINAAQMKQANDYLRVMVKDPKGTVNTAVEPFEIEYKDISVKKTTMTDVASVELAADLVSETRLNLYTCVNLKSGKMLIARYQNTCTAERDIELTNQYEIDSRITAIGSVVEWRNVREGNRRFHLYEKEGLTAPEEGAAGVEILLAEELFKGSEIDLATADPAKVQIRCGEFATGAGTTGTLTVKYKTDKFGTIEGLIISIDASKDGKRLRATYKGLFAGGYAASNTIKVTTTEAGSAAEAPIAALFSQDPQVGSYAFALGDTETATAPGDLAKGHWGAYVRVLAAKFGGVIDVATQTSDYKFWLYDYKGYQTHYGENSGLTGKIETHPNPAGGKEIYLQVNLKLKNGIGVEIEYYGVPTPATADAMNEEKLKPVKPFEPYIKFLDKDNKELQDWTVTAMEVRHDPTYQDNYTGEKLSGYCFYFRNDHSESIDEDTTTPMFFLPDSYLQHEGEIDLSAEGKNCKWSFSFKSSLLALYSQGYGYSDKDRYCMRCPEKATVTVKKEGKEWTFKFSMVDWGIFNTWNPSPIGTKNTLTIEFRGKATKYSGTKKNDLAADFYE